MSGTHCPPAASQIIPLVRGARWKRKSCLNATAAPGGLLAKRRLIATAVVLTTRGKSRRRGRFAGAVLVACMAGGKTRLRLVGRAKARPYNCSLARVQLRGDIVQRDLRILTNLDAIARRVAQEFVQAATAAVSEKGSFSVALSGGSTPKALYSLLANDAGLRAQLPWDKMYFYFVDER